MLNPQDNMGPLWGPCDIFQRVMNLETNSELLCRKVASKFADCDVRSAVKLENKLQQLIERL